MKPYIDIIQELLPQSEVFPRHTHSFLLQSVRSMSEKQMELLATILEEERERLSSLK